MTAFKVGDKVTLDGEGWDLVPKRGQVVAIERLVWQDFSSVVGFVGAFTLGGEEWMVWSEEGHVFHGSIVGEPLSARGLGYLDGSLNLPIASSDDEYLLGYTRGCEHTRD